MAEDELDRSLRPRRLEDFIGQDALKEKDSRRFGLAISAVFIAITVLAIWLLIRRLESDGSGYQAAPPQN